VGLGHVIRSRAPLVVAALALACTPLACSSDEPDDKGRGAEGSSLNPLAGEFFYVDPDSPAAIQAGRWRSEGRDRDAAAMALLASRPTATWLAEGGGVARRVRSLTAEADRAGQVALLVAYYIPGRDCGSYSAGGAESAGEYRAWIEALAQGLGNRRATIIVEPDAIAQAATGCLHGSARVTRYRLLRFALSRLAALPRATVYLDAGNAGWVQPAARLIVPLQQAGITKADGFALNVSNFYRTATTVSYGRALSRGVGGAHFVVDTGRNGNGPSRAAGSAPTWCNPPGRAVGNDPTTNTGSAGVDAYLWVKPPGTSDGACRSGAPEAGRWWPEYALELVRNR
jgi:endoglucanase